MSIVQVAVTQTIAGVACQTTWALVDNVNRGATPLLVTDTIDHFVNNFLPLLNAIQSDELANTEIYALQIGYPTTSRTQALTGTGALAATAAVTLPPYLALYVRENVGESVNAQTGGSYDQARAIRRGGVYLPGLTEDWVQSTGTVIPSALAAAWDALEAEIVAPNTIPIGGGSFYHAVWVPSKDAVPPSSTYPFGKPAAPFLQAPITEIIPRDIARLKSRKA